MEEIELADVAPEEEGAGEGQTKRKKWIDQEEGKTT